MDSSNRSSNSSTASSPPGRQTRASGANADEAEIDWLVYQLYGLTDEEVAMVDGERDPLGVPQSPEPVPGS